MHRKKVKEIGSGMISNSLHVNRMRYMVYIVLYLKIAKSTSAFESYIFYKFFTKNLPFLWQDGINKKEQPLNNSFFANDFVLYFTITFCITIKKGFE